MKNIARNIPYDPEVLDKLHRLQVEMLKDLDEICSANNITYTAVFGTALGAERHHGFIPWDDDIDVCMLREDYERFLRVMATNPNDKYKMLTPALDKNYACCVPKFQRKGTKFVSTLSKNLKCDQCIFIDIFPFDKVAPNEKQMKKQHLITLFYDRLIYLCGSAHPIIPYKGIKYGVVSIICWIVHYFMKIFCISPRFIYKLYTKECMKYSNAESLEFTYFGDGMSLMARVHKEDLFPVKYVKFENVTIPVPHNNKNILTKSYGDYMQLPPEEDRVNHAPLIIDFGDFEREGK